MTVVANGRVLADGRLLDPGWLEIDGERIVGVGEGTPPRAVDVDLGGRLVLPGFVDTHVHGGGGASYLSGDPEEAARVAAFHLQHGTTTSYASLITADLTDLEGQVRGLADLVEDGVLAGIHLEGPWLSAARCGAHDPRLLRAPERSELARILAAGRGTIRMVTLAPELPGGIDAVRQVVDAGAIAAVGHTDASYDVAREAIEAGATVATHLFNAMPPIHHRTPGPITALMNDERVTVEAIADGIHLHPGVIDLIAHRVGSERLALVTDAMTAAGAPDGSYELGGLEVNVVAGVARLADGDSIAGSTLTMDAAAGLSATMLTAPAVAAAAATTPARAHGLTDVGALRADLRADLVVLDPGYLEQGYEVVAVLRGGHWARPLPT